MEEERRSVTYHFEPGCNCQIFEGPMSGCVFAMPGANVSVSPVQQVGKAEEKKAKPLTHEELAKGVAAVQEYMWGASAYAVLFCECRDNRNYPNNKSQFEREVDGIAQELHLSWRCKSGTVSDAFGDSPYYNYKVDKWKENGAKERSLLLLERFQASLP